MTFEEVLERFDVVAGGTHPAGRCPAHDDRHASLSFTEGDCGQTLIFCHAGCTAAEIVEAVDLELADLFPERAPARPLGAAGNGRVAIPAGGLDARPALPIEAPEPLPDRADLERWRLALRPVMPWVQRTRGWSLATLRSLHVGFDGRRLTIPVADADGSLYNVLRYRPGGKPKMLATRGIKRTFYPAPERCVTADLWLLEGEPDAITARELLLPAVAIPGVGAWRAEWAERLRGRAVTVCMDSDAPGRDAAQRIQTDLWARGIPCVVVDLAPDRDDGLDLSDLLLAARGAGEMDRLRRRLGQLTQTAWRAA